MLYLFWYSTFKVLFINALYNYLRQGTVIDHNSDGKQDKLWALGRHAHENVVIKSDQSVLYWGADHSTAGYVYKFVPTTPGDFSEGSLFVLKTTASFGTGDWLLVSNTRCNR